MEKYHSEFKFDGYSFSGVQGFGGNSKPYHGLRKFIHIVLQNRFRKMASKNFKVNDLLAKQITTKQQRAYDIDVLRQSLTLTFLQNKLKHDELPENSTACIIGDGFASLTSLMAASSYVDTIIIVNLTKTLLVDLWYLRLWLGDEEFDSSVDLVTNSNDITKIHTDNKKFKKKSVSIIAIQAENHDLIQQCPIDIAVNIASMQEMDIPVIAEYFNDLRVIAKRRDIFFYCCNREEKELPDGTITRITEYPWDNADESFVDELCPWHQHYYTMFPPFYRLYDGPIRHRLVKLV